VEYCNKLSQKEGLNYKLPTEAEWEYACRAGTQTPYSFGDDPSQIGLYAWYSGNADRFGEHHAHQVAMKKPNPWGLYDMYGNVSEWCNDWYDAEYYFFSPPGEPAGDPPGPEKGSSRVLRGGSWASLARHCRSSTRYDQRPEERDAHNGFRVVAVPSQD